MTRRGGWPEAEGHPLSAKQRAARERDRAAFAKTDAVTTVPIAKQAPAAPVMTADLSERANNGCRRVDAARFRLAVKKAARAIGKTVEFPPCRCSCDFCWNG